MPKRIYLIRHGETDYNKEERMQGWLDIILNQNGHDQAEKLALRLEKEEIDVIYSSDLKRTVQTARALAKRKKIPHYQSRLIREHNMGVFEGWQYKKEKDYRNALWEEMMVAQQNHDLHWDGSQGETLHHFLGRVKRFINKIEQKHPKETVIIFTHGGTKNRILEVLGLKKVEDKFIPFDSTSVTILEQKDGEYVMTVKNDTSHLNAI